MVYLSYIFVYFTSAALPPTIISAFFSFPTHTAFLILSSLDLVVCPLGRLRGTMGERAVGRLCGHRARLFPHPTSNAAEPWPQWVLTLKISVERSSGSQTLFRTGLSIGGEKNLPPSQLWSVLSLCLLVKQGRTTGRHWPGQDFRKAYSACDLTPRFHCWLTVIKSWESRGGWGRGVLFQGVFHPLKCTLLTKFKITNDFIKVSLMA